MTDPRRAPFKRIAWPLAVAQTLLWAGLYYLFPALLGAWEREFGWSKAELTGALTAALLLAALLAPLAGRQIDAGRGRGLFIGATLGGALLLALLSQVTSLWQFYAVWLGLGVAMAGALYEPCFAILMRHLGGRARQAITLVTLIAGFAGTVAFPTAHSLLEAIGWRGVALVFAALLALIALPLNLYALSQVRAAPLDPAPPEAPAAFTGDPVDVTHLKAFWLLGLAFAMMAIGHGALIPHLLPLLEARSIHGEMAVLAAAMIGPMQVMGRLAMMAVEKHVAATTITAGSFLLMALAALALYGTAGTPILIVVFVLCQGAGYGVTNLLRPVLVAQLLGRRKFGVVAGMLAVPHLALFALAPILAGLVWSFGGYDLVIAMALVAPLLGLAALLLAARAAPAIDPTD